MLRLDQTRRSFRLSARRRCEAPLGDQLADSIVAGRCSRGDDVRNGLAANGDAHLLTAANRPQSLAQRPLQLTDADLAHVVILAEMRSHQKSMRRCYRLAALGLGVASTPAPATTVLRGRLTKIPNYGKIRSIGILLDSLNVRLSRRANVNATEDIGGLMMADFVFKNLSVKLLPAVDEPSRRAEACTAVYECGNCTEVTCGDCTDVSCGTCTEVSCGTCTEVTCGTCTNVTNMTVCDSCTCNVQTQVPILSVVEADAKEKGDMRAELAAHKASLRLAIAQVEHAERRPQSVEEVDELKSHLQEALAELEQRRAELETGADQKPA